MHKLCSFFVRIKLSVSNLNIFRAKSHLVCVDLVVLRKLCKKLRCFPGKFTQLVQITRQPVVTVATNLNSGQTGQTGWTWQTKWTGKSWLTWKLPIQDTFVVQLSLFFQYFLLCTVCTPRRRFSQRKLSPFLISTLPGNLLYAAKSIFWTNMGCF